jgi:pyruvate dehydrogenase E2 component (dihydrolipoamide acetyltransferase)
MAGTRFELPSLGADMDEGTLLAWRVGPGDRVRRGQVVAVVDTSKAAVDVEIWHDGVVEALLVEPGTKIPVGTAMMTLADTAASPAAASPRGPEPGPAAPPAAAPAAVSPAGPPSAASGPAPAAPPSAASGPAPVAPPSAFLAHPSGPQALIVSARHPVSPAARKRGRELDVDVEALQGTGPNGSVTVADVERAAAAPRAADDALARVAVRDGQAAAPSAAAPAPAAATVPSAVPSAAPCTSDRQAAMRASIAAAMGRAKREIPHYYLSETVPMERALDWLRRRNETVPIAERVLPAALLLKAVSIALARVPELNGTMRDGRFVPSGPVHAGVAIALRGGGLVAPAIHDVRDQSLAQLMRSLSDLVRRARAGSLRSSEMSDPTITVTQLGDQGVDTVFGVIYPPQVALVGFGRIAERPWAQDGWLRALPTVVVTLSADHRVSDGHRGALFLSELRERLQRPEALDLPSAGDHDG